jgi:hypothetical protein
MAAFPTRRTGSSGTTTARRLVVAGRLLPVALTSLLFAGCVSGKYKMAPKQSAAPSLELKAAEPAAEATLHGVVVFHGAGSWKRDAYWDEYLLTVTSPPDGPLTLEAVSLFDVTEISNFPGSNPWAIEKTSRDRLKVAKRTGRNIALGAGATAAWVGSAMLVASNITIWGGATNATAVAAGGAAFIGIPLVAVGSGVRTLVARHGINREFDRRRLVLPLTLPAGESRSGSLFFPVTPGPRRLLLQFKAATGDTHELAIDLTPLANLHLNPGPAPVR